MDETSMTPNDQERRQEYDKELKRRHDQRKQQEISEADEPRTNFIKEAMESGCPNEQFANFLWNSRCTCYHSHGDIFVGGST